MTTLSRRNRLMTAVVACVVFSSVASGWPNEINKSIARQVLATTPEKETFRLRKFEKDFLQGATLGEEALLEHLQVFPAETDIDTVDREIQLLREVARKTVSRHCAFRLGALTGFVADMSFPLPRIPANVHQRELKERFEAEALDMYRNQVYAFKPRRVIVSTKEYFSDVSVFPGMGEALLKAKYASSVVEDVTAGTLVAYFSNAVNSGGDVLHTILIDGPSLGPSYPPGDDSMAQYYLSELRYYLSLYDAATDRSEYATGDETAEQLDYLKEARRVINILGREEYYTSDIGEKMGDALFKVSKFDDGLAQYRAILSKDSTLKRVRDKVSAYYLAVGKKLKSEERWEDAREMFWNVLRNDLNHEEARKEMDEVKLIIQKRNERRAKDQVLIAEGNETLSDGAAALSERRIVDGIKKYGQAEKFFAQVTPEFADLQAQAEAGTREAQQRAAAAENLVISDIRGLRDIADAYTSQDEFQTALGQGMEEAVLRIIGKDVESQVGRLITEKILTD